MPDLLDIVILSGTTLSVPFSDGYLKRPTTEIKKFPHFGLSRSRVRGNYAYGYARNCRLGNFVGEAMMN